MSYRLRLTLALLAVALLPLLGAGLTVRRAVLSRLQSQDSSRTEAVARVITGNLLTERSDIRRRLARLGAALAGDDRFRLARQLGDERARAWLLDWAMTAMPLAGLDELQLQDQRGRILSSGQFRNDFGRVDSGLAAGLRRAGTAPALTLTRTPAAEFLAMVALDSITVAGARYDLIGGVAADSTWLDRLAGGTDLTVHLARGTSSAGPSLARDVALVEIDPTDGMLLPAALVIETSAQPLELLRGDIDRRFLLAGLAALVAAALAAALLSARLTGPLRRLAWEAGRVELEGSPGHWPEERDDEIGTVARGLNAMTARLRVAAEEVRTAERRAAVGDLARQLNHDIKNGLIPIRNVVRHLAEVAERQPANLASVFAERRRTLESGLAYLETLARNYARLTPNLSRERTALNPLVQDALAPITPRPGVRVSHQLAEHLPPVLADRVALRRILENLIGNALDSLPESGGTVTVQTEGDAAAGLVRLVVADTGQGMSRADLDAAFTDFRSSKTGGSGLGLTVVRRLVLDLNGRLRVETAPGSGSRFIVELPALADEQREDA